MSHKLKSQDEIEIKNTVDGLLLIQTNNVGEISAIFINHQSISNFLDLLSIELAEKIKK